MSIWIKRAVLALMVTTLVGGAGIALSQAQGDPIKERQALMKGNGESMKAIKAAVEANGPATAVAPEAAKIASSVKAAATHFPPGSDKGETKASPDIWTNMADFVKLDEAASAAASKLEASAKGGDMKVVAADFGDLGKACGACHNKYRLK